MDTQKLLNNYKYGLIKYAAATFKIPFKQAAACINESGISKIIDENPVVLHYSFDDWLDNIKAYMNKVKEDLND